jgi:serine phosphatase RsbU (regulator of sigma subunit)
LPPVSIRQSLLRNLVLIIVLMVAGISVVTVYGTRQLVSTLSRSIIESSLNFTEARIRGFLDPLPAALLSARGWAELGLLDDLAPAKLDRLFKPLLAQYQQIATVRVADERGREYLLTRRGKGFAVRETRADTWKSRLRWTEYGEEENARIRWQDSDYDPRQRSWYAAAEAADGNDANTHWSTPYRLPGDVPGITASIAADIGSATRVIAFDLQLKSVSAFIQTLRVSDGGGVMVLTSDGRIIGAPGNILRPRETGSESVLLRRPAELGWALAENAVSALSGIGPLTSPVRFRSEKRPYWGQARVYPLSSEIALFVAVVVPEADLRGPLPNLAAYVAIIVVLVLLVAILQAIALARRYSRPIEALVEESDRISRGDLDNRGQIETSVSEVQKLADAHDRMRSGLQSLMRLERDLAIARKIQQHTFPDRLPILPGFDIDAFSEPAEQTGGDTYDVIARSPSGLPAREDEDVMGAVLLLADVTGHGIGPALSAVQVRAMLRMAVRIDADLTMIARHVNAQLASDLFGGRFITAWIGELDARKQTLTYFSAGQAPLVHYHAKEDRFEFLDADAPPLGIDEDLEINAAPPLILQPGDIFAVFSDGVFESRGVNGARFGEDRVLNIIRRQRAESSGRILLEVRKALADFGEGAQAADDRTAVIIKRS